jgi:hypothetical protein
MIPSPISAGAAFEHLRELSADRANKAPRRSKLPELPVAWNVSIRYAGPSDARSLAALAALDSRRAPRGDVIVAELDGTVVVALGLDDGAVLANPFRSTADLVQMLELRAAQLRSAATPRRRWRATIRARRRAVAGR